MHNGTCIGIDVGAEAKGFHAVALLGKDVERLHTTNTHEVLRWCVERKPCAIGVDAPCRWRGGRERAAEREMRQDSISCFPTPSEDGARRTPFHAWMVNGAALYEALEKDFPLFDGQARGEICFETYPQAIACALAGRALSATRKRFERKVLLERAGIKTAALTGIDYVDAALCALTARHLVAGSYKTYGDRESGFIVVPKVEAKKPPFLRRYKL